MTFDEYKKTVHAGRRVYVEVNGKKMYGTAGNMYSAEGVEHIVQFDTGARVRVTEKSAQHFQVEQLN